VASNGNIKRADNTHCLNRIAVSVLKIKTIHAENFMKMNIYSFQGMADMHLFQGCGNGSSKDARHFYQQFFSAKTTSK
jgi:hypothetical protein